MKSKINELMAVSALLVSAPFIDSAAIYEVAKESKFNSRAIAHIRAINYDKVIAENTVAVDAVSNVNAGWWSQYLC